MKKLGSIAVGVVASMAIQDYAGAQDFEYYKVAAPQNILHLPSVEIVDQIGANNLQINDLMTATCDDGSKIGVIVSRTDTTPEDYRFSVCPNPNSGLPINLSPDPESAPSVNIVLPGTNENYTYPVHFTDELEARIPNQIIAKGRHFYPEEPWNGYEGRAYFFNQAMIGENNSYEAYDDYSRDPRNNIGTLNISNQPYVVEFGVFEFGRADLRAFNLTNNSDQIFRENFVVNGSMQNSGSTTIQGPGNSIIANVSVPFTGNSYFYEIQADGSENVFLISRQGYVVDGTRLTRLKVVGQPQEFFGNTFLLALNPNTQFGVDLYSNNICLSITCEENQTCNQNTGTCETNTRICADPCQEGEICEDGRCVTVEDVDAGADADLPEEDAADAGADADLPEEDAADTGADADLPEEDAADTSDTGQICPLSTTVNCPPDKDSDTPDLTPDTGTDSGNNKRPPAPKTAPEGCATTPGSTRGEINQLLLLTAFAGLALSRRKKAA